MPKKTKPKKPASTKTRIVVVVSVVIVSLVVLAVGVRAYRISQQRAAFAKADAVAAATIQEISDQLGEPRYVDRANVCYMRAPEEFAREVLFCRTVFAAYYTLHAANQNDKTAALMKDVVEKNYRMPLDKNETTASKETLDYGMGSRPVKELGNLNCAAQVHFPVEMYGDSHYLPERKFTDKNTLVVSVDCSKQSYESYYKFKQI